MSIVVFEHSDLVGSGRLGEILRDYGHRLRVIQLHRAEPVPIDLDDVDGVIVCGGFASATNENQPWLADEMNYIRSAHEADLPVVGLCLGSQILARALGGEVARVEGGIELGWRPVHLTAPGHTDIVHAGIGWTTMQLHWHRDCVITPPPGAATLAKSDRCAVQSWRLGARTYAFQYHPEIDMDDLHAWADRHPDDLKEAGLTRDEFLRQTEEYLPDCARLATRLFNNLALLVMPVDRRIAGISKDLHH